MKKKSEALAHFRKFKKDIQTHLGTEIKELHLSKNFVSFFQSDNGGEYTGKAFQEELGKAGTVHLTTAPDMPKQNGLAEQMNQTLVNTATAMLIESGLPKSFWSDAMQTVATVIATGLQGKIPYTMIFN